MILSACFSYMHVLYHMLCLVRILIMGHMYIFRAKEPELQYTVILKTHL